MPTESKHPMRLTRRTLLASGADLALLVLAFGATNLINYGHLQISPANWRLFKLQLVLMLVLSVAAGKWRRVFTLDYFKGVGLLFKVAVAKLFLLALIIAGMQQTHFSRAMAYGPAVGLVVLELVLLGFYYRFRKPVAGTRVAVRRGRLENISRPLLVLDGMLLLGAFLAFTCFKRGTLTLTHPYGDILFFLFGLWLAAALVTRKFGRDNFDDFLSAMGPALKSAFFTAAGLGIVVHGFRLEPFSRLQVFGPVALLLVLEAPVFWLFVKYRKHDSPNGDISDPGRVRELLAAQNRREALAPAPDLSVTEPVGERLEHALEFFDRRIFEMLAARVDLAAVDRGRCALLATYNMFNLDVFEDRSQQLVINLHKLNDIRWFNRYFLLAHQKLVPGGCILGKAHTIGTHRQYYLDHYGRWIGALFYGIDFVWRRVFPKLPWLQKLYFAVTQGRNRMVSRAEILGRLCFCGFRILDEQEFGHRYYFLAQKALPPSTDEHPTYGPLVRLRRSGLGGRPITVYKFRTMYPYSEYLQEYVYAQNQLAEGGKFKDDFRVTGWGRFMRRAWLDELPMLYNWIRGDLQVVGVRPLSNHYLSLYDADLQDLRRQVKPGLLPPFYADLPKTLEEIMESERRYIRAYLQWPLRTQAVYLCKGVWNIVVRRRRSA